MPSISREEFIKLVEDSLLPLTPPVERNALLEFARTAKRAAFGTNEHKGTGCPLAQTGYWNEEYMPLWASEFWWRYDDAARQLPAVKDVDAKAFSLLEDYYENRRILTVED